MYRDSIILMEYIHIKLLLKIMHKTQVKGLLQTEKKIALGELLPPPPIYMINISLW